MSTYQQQLAKCKDTDDENSYSSIWRNSVWTITDYEELFEDIDRGYIIQDPEDVFFIINPDWEEEEDDNCLTVDCKNKKSTTDQSAGDAPRNYCDKCYEEDQEEEDEEELIYDCDGCGKTTPDDSLWNLSGTATEATEARTECLECYEDSVAHPVYKCDGGCGTIMGSDDDCKRTCDDCDEEEEKKNCIECNVVITKDNIYEPDDCYTEPDDLCDKCGDDYHECRVCNEWCCNEALYFDEDNECKICDTCGNIEFEEIDENVEKINEFVENYKRGEYIGREQSDTIDIDAIMKLISKLL